MSRISLNILNIWMSLWAGHGNRLSPSPRTCGGRESRSWQKWAGLSTFRLRQICTFPHWSKHLHLGDLFKNPASRLVHAWTSTLLSLSNSDVSCVHMERRIPRVSCLTSSCAASLRVPNAFLSCWTHCTQVGKSPTASPWEAVTYVKLMPVASSALAPFRSHPPSPVDLHRPDLWKRGTNRSNPSASMPTIPGCAAQIVSRTGLIGMPAIKGWLWQQNKSKRMLPQKTETTQRQLTALFDRFRCNSGGSLCFEQLALGCSNCQRLLAKPAVHKMAECIGHFSGWLWANSNDIIASRNMLWRPPRSAIHSSLFSSVWEGQTSCHYWSALRFLYYLQTWFQLVSCLSTFAIGTGLAAFVGICIQGIKGVAAKCSSIFNQSVWSKSKLRSRLFPKMSCWLFSTWVGGGSLNKGKVGLPFTWKTQNERIQKNIAKQQIQSLQKVVPRQVARGTPFHGSLWQALKSQKSFVIFSFPEPRRYPRLKPKLQRSLEQFYGLETWTKLLSPPSIALVVDNRWAHCGPCPSPSLGTRRNETKLKWSHTRTENAMLNVKFLRDQGADSFPQSTKKNVLFQRRAC